MKKNFFLWSLLVVALMSICSCSSKSDKMLSLVPAEADVVMIGDVKTVMESAGFSVSDSKVKLPSWLKDLAGDEINDGVSEVNDFLKNSGVDVELCLFTFDFKKELPIIILNLDDNKKFAKYIENQGFEEDDKEDGISVYKQGDWRVTFIAIKDSYAYVIPEVSSDNVKPLKVIPAMIEDAKESSFAKTSMAKYISGNAFGVSFKMPKELRRELKDAGMPSSVMDLYNGYFCLKGSLDNDDIEIEAKAFDEDGKAKNMKEFEKMMDLDAKVSSKALAYLGKDESFVFASSLKDMKWSDYLDAIAEGARMSSREKSQLGIVEDYLKNIDGTIACGFGFTNGLESVFALDRGRDVFNQISVTLVVETKDGKAKKVMGDLEDLMSMASIPYDGSASKGFSITLDKDAEVNVKMEDNFIVISNHKIQKSKDNATVKKFDFDDHLAAFACYLDKDNKLMKNLGLKNDILFSYYGDPKDMEMTMKLEVKGGKGSGVLEKIGNMILTASKTDLSSYYPSYNSYDYGYGYEQTEIPATDYGYYGDSTVVEEATEYYEW
ncbi:MAG: hypothetical protein K2K82_03595 [Muribaculaceae bacterium]|nr:hypothetical protein [Muribaculaceae bacterium]